MNTTALIEDFAKAIVAAAEASVTARIQAALATTGNDRGDGRIDDRDKRGSQETSLVEIPGRSRVARSRQARSRDGALA